MHHVSVDRALRYLGIGARQLTVLPTGADGRLEPATLEVALSGGTSPMIVALNAGDLNLGAFDPYQTLIPLAHRHGAWVHVDGAFGLFARASSRFDAMTDGLDLADSWAADGHKWLNVPQDCGFVAVRHREAHRRGLAIFDSYLVLEDAARDEFDWNPEWSRRSRGFPVYAALRELGRDGLTALVDRCVDHCARLVEGIGALPGAEVVWQPTINQGLVRFLALARMRLLRTTTRGPTRSSLGSIEVVKRCSAASCGMIDGQCGSALSTGARPRVMSTGQSRPLGMRWLKVRFLLRGEAYEAYAVV